MMRARFVGRGDETPEHEPRLGSVGDVDTAHGHNDLGSVEYRAYLFMPDYLKDTPEAQVVAGYYVGAIDLEFAEDSEAYGQGFRDGKAGANEDSYLGHEWIEADDYQLYCYQLGHEHGRKLLIASNEQKEATTVDQERDYTKGDREDLSYLMRHGINMNTLNARYSVKPGIGHDDESKTSWMIVRDLHTLGRFLKVSVTVEEVDEDEGSVERRAEVLARTGEASKASKASRQGDGRP